MKYARSDKPGAFVLTDKATGQKYVMSEATLSGIVARVGEATLDQRFGVEWTETTEEEQALAKRIQAGFLFTN